MTRKAHALLKKISASKIPIEHRSLCTAYTPQIAIYSSGGRYNRGDLQMKLAADLFTHSDVCGFLII
jgi:hypothetical protein